MATTTIAESEALPIVPPEERLVLDVGGTLHKTTVHTLTTGRAEGSRLATTFKSPVAVQQASAGQSFFIDRNGDAFAHILHWLRTGRLPEGLWRDTASLSTVMQEAEFFKLQLLIEELVAVGVSARAPSSRQRLTQSEFMTWYKEAALADGCHTVRADGLDLSGLDLSGLDLTRWSLKRANLTNTTLEATQLCSVDLTDATLSGANFHGANLTSAILNKATISGTSFRSANLTGVQLEGAKLSSGRSSLHQDQHSRTIDFREAVLDNLSLKNADLSQLDLRGAQLTRVNLTGAKLSQANFAGTNLSSANLSNANLSGANLASTNLSSANLSSADLSGANLVSANLSRASLSSANLSGANLARASLPSANLKGSNLTSAKLRGAKLKGATLSSTNLTSSDLTSAVLSRAQLSSANLTSAKLCGAKLDNASLQSADLSSSDLSSATLRDAELSGAKLCSANLTGAILSCGAPAAAETGMERLWRASSSMNGRKPRGFMVQQPSARTTKTTGMHRNVDLTDSVFIDANLKGVTFESPDVTRADFTDAQHIGPDTFRAGSDAQHIQGLDSAKGLPEAVRSPHQQHQQPQVQPAQPQFGSFHQPPPASTFTGFRATFHKEGFT